MLKKISNKINSFKIKFCRILYFPNEFAFVLLVPVLVPQAEKQ